MSGPRVLLMHGIEGSPQGFKAQTLRARFEQFECIKMPTKETIGRAKKSLIAALAVAVLGVLVAFLQGLLASGWTVMFFLGLVGLAGWALRERVKRRIIPRLMETCVAMQSKAISDFKPDVVVASSWGGAVALECIGRGAWNGPTILLAPAHRVVAKASGCPIEHGKVKVDKRFHLPMNMPVLVVQGKHDTTVPPEHSFDLAMRRNSCPAVMYAYASPSSAKLAENGVSLLVVEDDHTLSDTCERHLEEWVHDMREAQRTMGEAFRVAAS